MNNSMLTFFFPFPHIGPINLLTGSTHPLPFSNWKIPSLIFPHPHFSHSTTFNKYVLNTYKIPSSGDPLMNKTEPYACRTCVLVGRYR